MKSSQAALLDASAVALSSLCLLHCLALPLLAAALPLFGAWAEAEWVHAVFVAIALPVTGFALWRAHRQHPLPATAWWPQQPAWRCCWRARWSSPATTAKRWSR